MGMCAAAEATITSLSNETFDGVINSLLEHKTASGVVCFCEGRHVQHLLGALKRRNLYNNFTVIGR